MAERAKRLVWESKNDKERSMGGFLALLDTMRNNVPPPSWTAREALVALADVFEKEARRVYGDDWDPFVRLCRESSVFDG